MFLHLIVLCTFLAWELARSRYARLLRHYEHEKWIRLGKPRGFFVRLLFIDGWGLELHLLRGGFSDEEAHTRTSAHWARWLLVLFLASATLWIFMFAKRLLAVVAAS